MTDHFRFLPNGDGTGKGDGEGDGDIKFGGIHGAVLLIWWCIVADGKIILLITFLSGSNIC